MSHQEIIIYNHLFGSAPTLYQSIKREKNVSCFLCDHFPKVQMLNFQPKKLTLPCTSHLNFHIYPNTWSVAMSKQIF